MLLRSIARGGSFVVLGLTASLFLFTALPDLVAPIYRLLWHAMSAVLILTGAWWWWRLPPLSSAWLSWSRQLLAAAILQVYLVPFYGWWMRMPHVGFFALNVAAGIIGLAWLHCSVGGLLSEIGRAIGDRHLQLEGAVASVLTPLCIIGPVAVAVLRTLWQLVQSGLSASWRALHPGLFLPPAVGGFLLFAFLFSMSVCVGTRLRLFREIRLMRASGSFDRDTSRGDGLSSQS